MITKNSESFSLLFSFNHEPRDIFFDKKIDLLFRPRTFLKILNNLLNKRPLYKINALNALQKNTNFKFKYNGGKVEVKIKMSKWGNRYYDSVFSKIIY